MTTTQPTEVYVKGTQVWIEDKELGWKSVTVCSQTVDGLKIQLQVVGEEGKTSLIETSIAKPVLPPLKNPLILDGVDDLTNLSYLHEPGVLHNISVRYGQHTIYTYSGIVLIATNPFQKVPLYSQEIIKSYSGKSRGDLDPHLFAIAEDAYRSMIRDEGNQTVIVSGESGAGKTMSAKFIMRYFASVNLETNSRPRGDSDMSETERQILATNPILESFGNAKTTRNDNSSRFGKYIEIQFDTKINIAGARIRTYLLERSRLIFQPESERNYHIFYQMCKGASEAEKKDMHLSNIEDYYYLKQGGQYTIPDVDDAEEFKITRDALSTIGINNETQCEIFRLCAALLHMGNIAIAGNDKSGANLPEADEALAHACDLLKIKPSDFRKWMVKKQIVTRSDKIISNLSPAQATVVRDSAAKFLYSNLFDWLIKRTNEKLANGNEMQVRSFIGVLDIYGFEHFQKNSFEQFCINYANEKLQQQFNQHVFKLEQEEYVKEEINWTFIEFSDNKPCIEIIEGKLGILALLDEQSRLPSGSDEGFVNKLYTALAVPANEKYFSKPRFGNTAFTVSHYAHDVTYESENFLDKNRDTVPDEILNVFQNSEASFVKEILPTPESQQVVSPKMNGRASATKRQTLGSAFKQSLNSLMETIGDTNVHYIRCIKPNENKTPWGFENKMVLSQLRACGVLETIRISCSGYPSRKVIEDFVQRYYITLPHSKWGGNVTQVCKEILAEGLKGPDKYQIGKTKVFFRAGQLGFLEKLRNDKINNCAIFIQKNVRRMLCRRNYHRLRFTTVVCRAKNVNKFARNIIELFRRSQAARMLQARIRGYLARKSYQARRESIIRVQTFCRGHLARRSANELKKQHAAILIQALARRHLARNEFFHSKRMIVAIQSYSRRFLAKRGLKRLKSETNPSAGLKETSLTLGIKLVSVSGKLRAKDQQAKELNSKLASLEDELTAWKKKYEDNKADTDASVPANSNIQDQEELHALRLENAELQKRCLDQSRIIEANEKELDELRILFHECKPRDTEEDLLLVRSNLGTDLIEPGRAIKSLEDVANGHRRSKTFGFNHRTEIAPSPTLIKKKRNPPQSVDLQAGRSSWNPLSSLFQPTTTDLPAMMEDKIEHLLKILESNSLVEEIVVGLIEKLNLPLPNFEFPRQAQEILFPAHMIGLCIIEMYKFDLNVRINHLISGVVRAVRGAVERAGGDFIFAFWFSNMSELLSSLLTASNGVDCLSPAHQPDVLSKAATQLDELLTEIMALWLETLQKRLSKLAIPAIVENQSLPGFVSNGTGFFNKIINQVQSSGPIDHALNLFALITKTMPYYFVDEVAMDLMVEYLLSFVAILSFNNIILRKDFCSWKRGMQIQFNITRLEEGCAGRAIDQQSINLEKLKQAAKLLKLQKATLQGLHNIYDVCDLLNPSQIKKLISIYRPTEYENPIPPEIIQEVARRAALTEGTDVLFLDPLPNHISLDYRRHFSRKISAIQKFIPDHFDLPHISFIVQMDK